MDVNPSMVRHRRNLEVFKSSIEDSPMDLKTDCHVRYKLLIDKCEDDSLLQMLLAFGILDHVKTKVLVCTKFPGDLDSVKVSYDFLLTMIFVRFYNTFFIDKHNCIC